MPCQIDLILLHKRANDRFIVSIAVLILFLGQALLQSIGGGCVEYFHPENGLQYNNPNPGSGISQWCNDQGVIAFRQKSELEKLLNFLNPDG